MITKDDKKMSKILKIKTDKIRDIRKQLTKNVKSVPKGAFKLPIQTAIIVPSTYKTNKKITNSQFQHRVAIVRTGLSRLFGGFTKIKGVGGYYSTDKQVTVREKNVMVIAFAEKALFMKRRAQLFAWVKKLRDLWKQESIGIIIENDMFYI